MNSQDKIIFVINKKSIFYVIITTLFLQFALILYNNYIGFIHIQNIEEFVIRLLYGTFFASIIALYLFVLNIKVLNRLNDKYWWKEAPVKRLFIELFYVFVIGVSGAIIITVIVQIISPYKESFEWVLFINSMIAFIGNIIMMAILEAIHFYKKTQESKLLTESLAKENAIIKLETLKSQLNPHFLFNSLNVLSTLIKKDSAKAQQFVDQFALVNRYSLEVIDKPVVELREELEFSKSYLFLQKIRFDNSIISEINVDASKLNYFVPPLAVQTLIENALKHNRASEETPLTLKIYIENNFLVVSNNLRPKFNQPHSSGVGLSNLQKRYAVISNLVPEFIITDKEYLAKIPLIIQE